MTSETPDRSRWSAILWLLPTAVLAVPSVLAADPLPHAAATGWTLLLALPALVHSCFNLRRGLPLAAFGFLPILAIAAWSHFDESASDRFELDRTVLLLTLSFAAFLAGTNFSNAAGQTFQRGASLLSLVFTFEALLASNDLAAAGSLGNSGVLSAVALPGAVLGALSITRGPLIWRVVGALSALAFATYSASAPVLTGVLSFSAALLVFAIRARPIPRSLRFTALACAGLAPLLLAGLSFFSAAQVTAAANEDLGGAEVRLRIWQAIPNLVQDHALTGIGPGQFRAVFPAYRDRQELELSTFQHAFEAGNEVEHAHSDVFQMFAEYGLIGGSAFAAMLALIALSALKRMRSSDSPPGTASALGAACLALLFNATLHAPLSFEPASALLAWVLFGALLNQERRYAQGLQLGRLLGWTATLVLFASLPEASLLTRHGELLADRQRAVIQHQRETTETSSARAKADAEFWLEEGRVLRELIEVAPNSSLAQTLLARHFASWKPTPATIERSHEAWTRVLELRPHQVSALIGLGLLADDTAERRELWEHALRIDPHHPIALQNLARLETLEGDPDLAFDYITRLEQQGLLDRDLIRDLGSRALIAGRTPVGSRLLTRLGLAFDFDRPDDLFALSQQEQKASDDSLFADALACGAHRLWGLANLDQGELNFARSKFRQALKISRRYIPGGDLPTRLLLAASLELVDRTEEAQSGLESLALDAIPIAIWNEYPEAVRSALLRLGLRAETTSK